ncbi:unnamed protein product [Symbiodinium sp. CCMP2456]|nr:unnamed protein product [Symbiodinium sp. CCMP2456]
MAVTLALRAARLRGVAVDLQLDPRTMDLLQPAGFCLAVVEILRLRPGSLVVIALDCRSFSSMSRWSSGRSLIKLWGYKDREFVASGNKLSSRVALLIYLCQWRSLRWLLEQPDGSMLPHLPRFQKLWKQFDVYHSYFWMGKFNGPTPKRHRIWSNCFSLVDGIQQRAGHMLKSEMERLTKRLVNRYEDKLGTKRFTGKRKELRESQILG